MSTSRPRHRRDPCLHGISASRPRRRRDPSPRIVRVATSPRPVSAECPRRGRSVAASPFRGLFASRRRSDPSTQKIHVAAAASPRFVRGRSTRPRYNQRSRMEFGIQQRFLAEFASIARAEDRLGLVPHAVREGVSAARGKALSLVGLHGGPVEARMFVEVGETCETLNSTCVRACFSNVGTRAASANTSPNGLRLSEFRSAAVLAASHAIPSTSVQPEWQPKRVASTPRRFSQNVAAPRMFRRRFAAPPQGATWIFRGEQRRRLVRGSCYSAETCGSVTDNVEGS